MKHLFIAVVSFVSCAFSVASFGDSSIPHNENLAAIINNTFLNADGQVSSEKVERFSAMLKKAMAQNKQLLVNAYRNASGDSVGKAEAKADKHESTIVYQAAIELLAKLSAAQGSEARMIAQKVLDLDFSLKSDPVETDLKHTLDQMKAFAREYFVAKRTPNAVEASNLVSRPGRFFTQEELRELKQAGSDISRLNPPADASFWQALPIEKVSVTDNYYAISPLYKDVKIVFPTDWVEYDEVKKSQASPKLSVKRKIDGTKYEYKLKLGREVHSERTSGALFSALGFHTDPTKYVRGIKMYLGKSTERELRREWASYYGKYNLDNYIASRGNDEMGEFIVFTEGLLEAKPDELLRPGSWGWGALGNAGKREARGLVLLSIWVGNKDLKETENNKLVLHEKSPAGTPYFLVHDLGWSFGQLTVEKPGAFAWDLVEKHDANKVLFNYKGIQLSTAYSHITYDDARWATRLIARLSREQIAAAVRVGHWPESVGLLLTEKLVARRNQLVEAFGLQKEFASLRVNRKITTPDGVVVEGELKQSKISGYPQEFGRDVRLWVDPIVKAVEKLVVTNAFRAANLPLQSYEIETSVGGGALPFVSKVKLRLNREIALNREPTSANDRYLVRDNLRVGLELGAGIVVRGAVGYARDYTLVYPVATEKEGLYNTQHILNLFLPFAPEKAPLPARYALVLEDYLEGKGVVEFASGASIGVEAEGGIGRVYMNRLLISDKGDGFVRVVEDSSAYTEASFKARAAFGVLKIPFLQANWQSGKMERDYWEIEVSKSKVNENLREALAKLRLTGDVVDMEAFANHKKTRADFVRRRYAFQILGVNSYSRGYNRYKITETTSAGRTKSLQIERYRDSSWRFFSHGERHYGKAFFLGAKNTEGGFDEPMIGVNMNILDRSTRVEELTQSYLSLLNGVALNSRFIEFSPNLFNRESDWGQLVIMLDVLFYKEAIGELLRATPGELMEAFYQVTGKNQRYWQAVERVREASPEKAFYAGFKSTLSEVLSAQKEKSQSKRMDKLVGAFRNAILKMGETFRPEILATLHKIAGSKNIYLSARITSPEGGEIALPNGKPIYNVMGENRYPEYRFASFDLSEVSDLYNFFDTGIERYSPIPSSQEPRG
jgi:hypothetical protein